MPSLLVLLYSILTIVSASMQVVAFKSAGYALGPYPYFILLSVSFAFIPIFFLGVLCINHYGTILPAARKFEYKKAFAMIGLLNGLNGILIIFSNPHVSGVAQSTLSQFVIPLTLSLSVCILRASFSKLMYFGAFVIMCGVGLELSPTFISPKTFLGGNVGGASGNGWWSVVFALGQVPAALCSIYQEQAFTKGVRINVVYMMAWSSLAQFISLLIAVPLNFIPGFGNSGGSVAGFMDNMYNATLCVGNRLPQHEECSRAGLLLSLCIVSMLLTNVFQALLVKHSSASLSVLVLTLITPTSTFCFTLPFLMGKDHTETMSTIEIAALVVLMIGVVVYRYADVVERKQIEVGDVLNDDNSSGDSRDRARDRASSSASSAASSSHRQSRSISSRPLLMGTRSGIINSEYTGGQHASTKRVNILFEGTVFESRVLQEAHQSAPLLISQSVPNEGARYGGRMVKSERKATRPSSSFV